MAGPKVSFIQRFHCTLFYLQSLQCLCQFIGSKEIGNYRGNTVVADSLSEVRKSVSKKQKVQVTIRFKGMVVTDEKTKVSCQHYFFFVVEIWPT